MATQLTPALGAGAEYVALPFDGGHQMHADPAKPGANGNLYDLAGPLLAAWLTGKVMASACDADTPLDGRASRCADQLTPDARPLAVRGFAFGAAAAASPHARPHC